jgi:hypothetical protein
MVVQHAKRTVAAGPGDAIGGPALGEQCWKRGITIAGGTRATRKLRCSASSCRKTPVPRKWAPGLPTCPHLRNLPHQHPPTLRAPHAPGRIVPHASQCAPLLQPHPSIRRRHSSQALAQPPAVPVTPSPRILSPHSQALAPPSPSTTLPSRATLPSEARPRAGRSPNPMPKTDRPKPEQLAHRISSHSAACPCPAHRAPAQKDENQKVQHGPSPIFGHLPWGALSASQRGDPC